MVKGVSRQVIVLHTPDQKLFEQAIFILKEDCLGEGVTEQALLKEAQGLLRGAQPGRRRNPLLHGAVWAAGGSLLTGLAWLLTILM